jgi:hypothetical protein
MEDAFLDPSSPGQELEVSTSHSIIVLQYLFYFRPPITD